MEAQELRIHIERINSKKKASIESAMPRNLSREKAATEKLTRASAMDVTLKAVVGCNKYSSKRSTR